MTQAATRSISPFAGAPRQIEQLRELIDWAELRRRGWDSERGGLRPRRRRLGARLHRLPGRRLRSGKGSARRRVELLERFGVAELRDVTRRQHAEDGVRQQTSDGLSDID